MKNLQLEKSKVEVFAAGRLVESFKSEKELLSIAPARICEWDAMARKHARDAVRLALGTGALLLEVKSRLPHGAFLAWLSTSCRSVSVRTAQNYMALAEAAQRDCRALAGGPDGDGEIIEGEATVSDAPAAPSSSVPRPSSFQIDERSLSQLYLDYGIVRRPPKWGGDRRDKAAENGHTVGRPSKGSPAEVAKELDAAANSEALLWSASKGAIGTLLGLDRDKDFLRRLTDEHLAVAARSLADLSKKAGELLSARLARRDMGLHGEEMETGEVLKVLERGL